ncbi:PspC domain-containing protein [Paenibacillus sedimenti]|uniref:PspC domain-containing protein n=1 Tax=Paenibacillus sedimenti TaxID=2770274 RepID=A0A926KSL8_9BACL|nr:PspC domain-containing protein [Paenibacillus sedimenti]MBD0381434.1 PspC domain-containing protein [Paenibacillus sedimenti]
MKKIYRSTSNSRLTGICGGIAQYLGINATLIRLVMVIAAICSIGTTVLLYFIASMLIPKEPYIHFS